MANICENRIGLMCSSAEWEEISKGLENDNINWSLTYDGVDTYSDKSIYCSTKWSPRPIEEGHMSKISEMYPTVLFEYSYEIEGGYGEDTCYYINGKDYKNKKFVNKEGDTSIKDYFERLTNQTSEHAEGIGHIVELMPQGIVAADGENRFGECDIYDFENIVQVACGDWHTVVLDKNGKAYACGSNYNGQCNIPKSNKKIIKVSCGRFHTVFLFDDGSVGYSGAFDKSANEELSKWSSITDVVAVFDGVAAIDSENKLCVWGNTACSDDTCKLFFEAFDSDEIEPEIFSHKDALANEKVGGNQKKATAKKTTSSTAKKETAKKKSAPKKKPEKEFSEMSEAEQAKYLEKKQKEFDKNHEGYALYFALATNAAIAQMLGDNDGPAALNESLGTDEVAEALGVDPIILYGLVNASLTDDDGDEISIREYLIAEVSQMDDKSKLIKMIKEAVTKNTQNREVFAQFCSGVAELFEVKDIIGESFFDSIKDDNADAVEFTSHNTEVLDKAIEKLEAAKKKDNNLTADLASEIQDVLSDIDEDDIPDELASQIGDIKSQLEDVQEKSAKIQDFEEKLKAEEQKRDEAHKKLMEERGSSEDSNEVTMYFSLLIEKSVGKIRRGQNDFYNCYSEDFPGLSKTELIELRKAIIPKMNDKDFVNRCNDAFSQFSFEYRYEILMLGSFNISLAGNPPEAKEHALNLCKEYFSEDEIAEGAKLLDNEIENIRQTLVDNLSAADTKWLKFDTARESLRFNAEEKFKNYDSKNIFQFKRYDGCCYIVLSSGVYSAPINNFFPWFWGVSVTDIYDAANENPVNDMTDTIYGAGEFIAEEATEKAYKKYGNGKTPPSKDEYREPSATEKAAIKKLKDMVKLADGNKKLISDFYANAPIEFINAAEDLVDSLNSSSNDVIFKFKNQSDEVLLAYVRSNGVSQVNSLYNQFDELSREIKNVFAKYGLTGNSSTVSQNTSSTSSTSTNNNSSSGCCYVATCAYGSYDCPEVWTLRRFRDYVLAKTWYGRLFITLYYFFAPYLVKFFGDTEWFKSAWRKYLDKKVEKLNNEGFENTPYQDIDW